MSAEEAEGNERLQGRNRNLIEIGKKLSMRVGNVGRRGR